MLLKMAHVIANAGGFMQSPGFNMRGSVGANISVAYRGKFNIYENSSEESIAGNLMLI